LRKKKGVQGPHLALIHLYNTELIKLLFDKNIVMATNSIKLN